MATTTNDDTKAALPVENLDQTPPTNIPPATNFSTSGAPVQIVPDVDPDHPAVDNDPRAGTTVRQNAIEFNDPTISGAEAVARKLGMKVEPDVVADPKAKS